MTTTLELQFSESKSTTINAFRDVPLKAQIEAQYETKGRTVIIDDWLPLKNTDTLNSLNLNTATLSFMDNEENPSLRSHIRTEGYNADKFKFIKGGMAVARLG